MDMTGPTVEDLELMEHAEALDEDEFLALAQAHASGIPARPGVRRPVLTGSRLA